MFTRSVLPRLLVLVALAIPSVARADLPPGDACDGNATVGSPCRNANASVPGQGEPGTCQKSTCSHSDYGHWDRDASSSPPTEAYQCLLCKVAADGGTRPDGAAAPTGGTDGGTADQGGDKSGGCAIGSGARPFGPWLLGAAFAALVSLKRRRRR